MEERPRNGKITDFNKPFIEQRADPFVMRAENGKYYFTASVPAYDKIILRCSDTLPGLKDAKEKVIWTKHESGEMSRHIWAPELHYLFGKWYIYFAASMEEDIWRLRPYILECQGSDPMKDEWIEKGKIRRSDDDIYSFDAFSLDATILENKGEYYYIWAEKVSVGIQISNIYIAKMESATKLKTAQVLLTTPDYDWERVDIWVNEDADLLDPRAWKKERHPVLCSDREKGIYGPGHNSFTKTEDGRDVCVYHARTYPEIVGDPLYDPNRHTMLMEVKWDEDGKPVFRYENNIH